MMTLFETTSFPVTTQSPEEEGRAKTNAKEEDAS
jgi:hypothetical protein